MTNVILPILFLFLFLGCYPADPNYATKPLSNIEHNGFVSKDFFQVVVTTEIEFSEDRGILEERIFCKNQGFLDRDKKTIEILKKEFRKKEKLLSQPDKVASVSQENDRSKELETFKITNDLQVNKGDFRWFLDKMFIYLEDYSEKGKCKFVFRAIEKDLYHNAKKTTLIKETD
jgi:hypothetical protein